MRTIRFIPAFAFVQGGPTLAGALDAGLPGIGTFAYDASPIVAASSSIVVAAR